MKMEEMDRRRTADCPPRARGAPGDRVQSETVAEAREAREDVSASYLTMRTLNGISRMSSFIGRYNVKQVHYDVTGEIDVVTYSNPIVIGRKVSKIEKRKRSEGYSEDSIRRSVNRAKQKIYDLARANNWQWFLTMTFNKDVVGDRYDYDNLTRYISKFLDRLRKRSDVKYIVVPEKHKDGAFHFHGLFADVEWRLVDSGKRSRGKVIYNVLDYQYGFTTVTEVEDTLKASSYLTKYVTKDLIISTRNKKRYWASRNLRHGRVIYDLVPVDVMEEVKRSLDDAKRKKRIVVDAPHYYNEIDYFTI